MDIPKFTLDRNSYLNQSATGSLYDTTKVAQATAAYSAYLDSSVLTKAYFDTKMYQDRAAAANYALDISKIYSAQQQSAHQHQQQQQHLFNGLGIGSMHCGHLGVTKTTKSLDERRDSTPQHMDNDNNGNNGGGNLSGPSTTDIKTHLHTSNDSQIEYAQYAQQYGQLAPPATSATTNATTIAINSNNANMESLVPSTTSGDYRRPFTVIF